MGERAKGWSSRLVDKSYRFCLWGILFLHCTKFIVWGGGGGSWDPLGGSFPCALLLR